MIFRAATSSDPKKVLNVVQGLRFRAFFSSSSFDAASDGFRRIMGHEHLWTLKAALDEPAKDRSLVQQAVAG